MENEFFRFKIHPWILVNITHRISFKNPHLHFPQTMHTFGSDFIIVINWAILNLFVTQTACTFIGTREFLSYWPRGVTSLYKPYSYVSPHWVEFLVLFGLETRIHFAHFGLESSMIFEGTTGVYERIYCFNSTWIRTK